MAILFRDGSIVFDAGQIVFTNDPADCKCCVRVELTGCPDTPAEGQSVIVPGDEYNVDNKPVVTVAGEEGCFQFSSITSDPPTHSVEMAVDSCEDEACKDCGECNFDEQSTIQISGLQTNCFCSDSTGCGDCEPDDNAFVYSGSLSFNEDLSSSTQKVWTGERTVSLHSGAGEYCGDPATFIESGSGTISLRYLCEEDKWQIGTGGDWEDFDENLWDQDCNGVTGKDYCHEIGSDGFLEVNTVSYTLS